MGIYWVKRKKSRERKQHVQRSSGWRPVLLEQHWVRRVGGEADFSAVVTSHQALEAG